MFTQLLSADKRYFKSPILQTHKNDNQLYTDT